MVTISISLTSHHFIIINVLKDFSEFLEIYSPLSLIVSLTDHTWLPYSYSAINTP